MARRGIAALLAAVLAALAVMTGSARATVNTRPSRSVVALRLLADLVRGDDKAIVATFNPQMKRAVPASRLAGSWAAFQVAFGRYLGHGRPVVVPLGTLTVVRISLRMARRPGEFRISFQPDGRVAGLYLLRTGVPL